MNAEEEVWVETALQDAERKGCIARVLKVQRSEVVAKGDNYTSDLWRLKLRVALYSGDIEERSVIYKCLPSTELRRKHMAESGIFYIEQRMYTEVLPLMEKIRKEKETGEPLWGQCYAARNYETLMLEDLAVSGYKMGDRMNGLDYDHCKLVMKSLAKFHALGAVLKQRGGLVVRDYEKHFIERNPELICPFYKSSFEGLADVIEEQWKGEWIPYAEKLRKKANTVYDESISSLSTNNSAFLTLNHGDCWVNNILFKYGEDNKPISLRFLDFQVVSYKNVGLDLQYFLNTSTTLEMRNQKHEFLQIYYHSLEDNLHKFGYTGKIPKFDDVLDDCNTAMIYGIAQGICVVPFLKMPSKNVPDMEELFLQFEESQEFNPKNTENNTDECVNAIKCLITEAEEKGLI